MLCSQAYVSTRSTVNVAMRGVLLDVADGATVYELSTAVRDDDKESLMGVSEVSGSASRGFSVGIDVGGTFTDLACGDGESSLWRAKSPTDPQEFGRGVLGACRLAAEQIGLELGDFLGRVERFGLGTTAVTNALVEKHGVRAGLLTTVGFEDTIAMARSRRISIDGYLVPPWSPIERSCVVGAARTPVWFGTRITC